MAQYGLRKDDGGVGAPVGLTVFKTAGGRSARSPVGSTPIRLCLFPMMSF